VRVYCEAAPGIHFAGRRGMQTPDPFFQTSSLEAGVTCVRLAGEIDLPLEQGLRQALDDLIQQGHTRLLVDLSDVSFIDSSGLGVLLHAAGRLRRRGGLAVVCPDPAMRGMFELVGLNLLFPVDQTLDEALHHLKPRRRFGQRQARPSRAEH
jgi:anti-sigma B factor antagonist